MPLEHEVDGIRVRAFTELTIPIQDFVDRYPYLYFEGNFVYFNGTLMKDVCSENDIYYETDCSTKYEDECPGIFMTEIIPGSAGCLYGEGEQRKGFAAEFSKAGYGYDPFEPVDLMTRERDRPFFDRDISYSSASLDNGQILRYEIPWNQELNVNFATGSFVVPEGARSFQLVSPPGSPLRKLIDPNGNEHLPLPESRPGDPLRQVRFMANSNIVITQSTSDIDYSHDDIVIPGEWTYEARNNNTTNDSSVVVVIKTRNDSDDKLRLKVVNATTLPNEAFGTRLNRLVEHAALLGINLEITGIEKIRHHDNPHDPPSDFCEQFCSSDEAVVFITEPGGWSSPGPGLALAIDYNSHFLVGAEVATSDDDSVLTAALHELLHYAAGLGHLYETHIDGDVDADDLKSTGVHNEVVAPAARITGGVNYKRLWGMGELFWNDNIMAGWRMEHDVPDDDGWGWTGPDGKRLMLVTFLEYHQLEWLKNSPFYW